MYEERLPPESSWKVPPFAVPACEAGVLAIDGQDYLAMLFRANGYLVGVQLTKEDGEKYHLDPGTGECDCPDHQYRKRLCKHVLAVRQVLAEAVFAKT